MSTTIAPGTSVIKDPHAIRMYQWDWDELLSSGTEIATATVVVSGSDNGLTATQVTRVSGNRKVNVLLSAGTLGVDYTVTCRIVTNEAPAQTEDRSIIVRVAQQ